MSHHLSMSKIALAKACSWGFRSDAPQHPRPAGRPARVGSATHVLMERKVNGKDVPFKTDDKGEIAEAEALFSKPVQAFLDSLPWTACEIGFRYDTRTDAAKIGPRRGEPGYEDIGPTEIPGTLDLVCVEPDCVVVVDLKSGKHVEDREQLYAQAVAAARYYDKPTAKVGYVYARKTKCDAPVWETLDADALDLRAGQLSKLMKRLPIAPPVAGDYCWKCDARPSCPAFGAESAEHKANELEEAGYFG